MWLEIQKKCAFIDEYGRQASGTDGMERSELLHNFLAPVLTGWAWSQASDSTVWEGEG